MIGTSLGGFRALSVLLAGIPAEFPLPIAVVQHRRPGPDELLCELLRRHAHLPVSEPLDKTAIVPGRIHLAPADYHLLVENGRFALTTESPVAYARPSIDVLFESAAHAYGSGVTAVVLTGANNDGARGVAAVRDAGGTVIIQDPERAESDAMPLAALRAVPAATVLPLETIAAHLVSATRSGKHA